MIARRHFFHVGGYDPIGVEARYRRFRRDLAVFARTWNVTAVATDLVRAPDNSRAWWTVTTQGRNWRVETTYEVLLWDDILLVDFARPMLSRLGNWVVALFDFLLTGTVFRYFRASWRYAFFFFFPAFHLLLFAYVALLLAHWLTLQFALTSPLATIAIGIAVFLGLLQWPGRWWRVGQALDDWIFAREFLRGRRRDVDARLDGFAATLMARARDTSLDEIVILGHSLGASLVIDFVARALARDPELGRHGPSVNILSVGSTIPKFALHPAGDDLRRKMARVAAEPTILWGDYQARHDFISFYKFDPVSLTHFDGKLDVHRKPIMRLVAIPDMIEWATMQRYRFRFLRLHYQFVMANERRAHYDYFMLICGPVPLARTLVAPHGFLDLIAADGSFTAAGTALPTANPAREVCGSDRPQ